MINYDEILNIQFVSIELGKITIRGYLCALLETLWEEKEGFSGKRPFGNSGWDYDLILALVQNNIIEGKLDEFGCIIELDKSNEDFGNQIIFGCISHVFNLDE